MIINGCVNGVLAAARRARIIPRLVMRKSTRKTRVGCFRSSLTRYICVTSRVCVARELRVSLTLSQNDKALCQTLHNHAVAASTCGCSKVKICSRIICRARTNANKYARGNENQHHAVAKFTPSGAIVINPQQPCVCYYYLTSGHFRCSRIYNIARNSNFNF